MALQTLTTSAGSAQSTSDPEDGNNNSNPFSLDPGTPPLIPAFLVTGMLLVLIIGISTFRRVIRRRRMMRLGLVDGHGAWGPWGADLPGPHIGHARRAGGFGPDRRFEPERRGVKIVDLGMKPRIWDVWVQPEQDIGADDYTSKESEASIDWKNQNSWEDLLPLSVAFPKPLEPSSSTSRLPIIPSRTRPAFSHNRIVDRIARYLRPPPPLPRHSDQPLPIHNMTGPGLLPPSSMSSFIPPVNSTLPPQTSHLVLTSSSPISGDSLNVAVIIAMPFSSLPSNTGSEKFGLHSEDNDDFEYALGVSEVSLRKTRGPNDG